MQSSLAQLTLFLFGLIVVWLAVEAARRLFLGPLAHIPGPRLTALTSWYEFYYDVIKPGQYVWKIKDLHAEYGGSTSCLPCDNAEWLL